MKQKAALFDYNKNIHKKISVLFNCVNSIDQGSDSYQTNFWYN